MTEMKKRTALEVAYLLAAVGHGWFRSTEAFEAGVPASTLTRWRSRGLIVSPRRNLNRLVDYPSSWEASAMGAVLAAGPVAALARYSALRLHERRTSSPTVDVVVPRGAHLVDVGLPQRTHARLTPADIVQVDGFPVTSPEFTVCDLAAVAPPEVLLEVTERFLANGRLDVAALTGCVRRFRAVKGVHKLRDLVDHISPSVEGTRSDHERLASRIIRSLGIPLPVADHPVLDADGNPRFLDFAWPDLMLAVEIDVHESHLTTLGRRSDGRRQNALVLAGWTVLRFDEMDLREHPERVAAVIREAYAAAVASR